MSLLNKEGSTPSSGAESIAAAPMDVESQLKGFLSETMDQCVGKEPGFGLGTQASLSELRNAHSFVPAGLGNTMDCVPARSDNSYEYNSVGLYFAQDDLKDPFISIKTKGEQKLSPTASAFQPYALKINPSGINYPTTVSSVNQASSRGQLALTGNSGITIDTSFTANSMAAEPVSPASSQGSFGITQLGNFSTDGIVTRALHISSISGIYAPISAYSVEAIVKVSFETLLVNNVFEVVSLSLKFGHPLRYTL
jgi:hypothetical protein